MPEKMNSGNNFPAGMNSAPAPSGPSAAMTAGAKVGKLKLDLERSQSSFENFRGITENGARIIQLLKDQMDFRMEYMYVQNQLREVDLQKAEIEMRKAAPSSNKDIRDASIADDARQSAELTARRANLEAQLRILEVKIAKKDQIYSMCGFMENIFQSYPAINEKKADE